MLLCPSLLLLLLLCCNLLLLVDLSSVLWGPSRHLGISTTANWVSFDFNVSYSSCWGYSLINTLKLKKFQLPPSPVRHRSAADSLIRSAVDISHPRQQGKPTASSSAISGSVRSDIIIDLGSGTVGGGGLPSLVSSMPPCVFHGPDDSVSAPPSSDRGNYLSTQSQASYHSTSSSHTARRPSSCFDGVNEEADVRANATVVNGYAHVRASAVMTEDNDDGANVGKLDDILSDILHPGSQLLSTLISLLAPSTSPTASHALHYSLHSPPSHPPPPLLLLLLLLGSPSEIQEFSLS